MHATSAREKTWYPSQGKLFLICYSAHVKLRDHVRADVLVGKENLLLLRRRKRNSTMHFFDAGAGDAPAAPSYLEYNRHNFWKGFSSLCIMCRKFDAVGDESKT